MDKEILTMEDAAELFGVSIKTFIKLLKEEKVPGRKIGREWRFSRQALIDWLAAGDSQIYSSSEVEVKEFFDEVASEWEELSRSYYDESIKNKLSELPILNKSVTLMDLGAGDGYIARFAAKSVKKVYAVDISEQMLKELRKKAQIEGLRNIETIQSDGLNIPVNDSFVDLLCANMYLHHIEDPMSAIKEMHRVLKSGGLVFLADFFEHSDTQMLEKMHDIWPGFSSRTITGWFQQIGFHHIEIQKVTHKDSICNTENTSQKVFVLIAQK